MFIAGVSPKPVWRDGLTTNLSYVFLAVKAQSPEYNAVVYGNQRIKFYPSADDFGLTAKQLQELGCHSYCDRRGHRDGGYERWLLPSSKIESVLQVLRGQRGVVVAPHPPAVDNAIASGENRHGGEHPRGRGRMPENTLVSHRIQREQAAQPVEAAAA